MMVIGFWYNSNSVPSSKQLYRSKKGVKVQKMFPKYGGKDYLQKIGFYGFD